MCCKGSAFLGNNQILPLSFSMPSTHTVTVVTIKKLIEFCLTIYIIYILYI